MQLMADEADDVASLRCGPRCHESGAVSGQDDWPEKLVGSISTREPWLNPRGLQGVYPGLKKGS
jgi:hypothetical protein